MQQINIAGIMDVILLIFHDACDIINNGKCITGYSPQLPSSWSCPATLTILL